MVNKKKTLGDLDKMIDSYRDYLIDKERIPRTGKDTFRMITLREEMENLSEELEKKKTDLSVEKARIEKYDRLLIKNADFFLRNLRKFINLSSYREGRAIPSSHWWWYLDEVIERRRKEAIKKLVRTIGIAVTVLICGYIVVTKIIPEPEPYVQHQLEGDRFYEEGKLDEAIEEYKKSLELNPKSVTPYIMLGMIYEDKNENEKAQDYFSQGKKLFTKETDFYNQRGMTYYQKGKLDKAALDAQKVLEIEQDNAAAHFLLGNVYEREGKTKEAIAEYQIVSDLDADPQLTVLARYKMAMLMKMRPLREIPEKILPPQENI